MHHCPKCKSSDTHRSRAKSTLETWRKQITGRRLYRCSHCGWRGWSVDLGPKFGNLVTEIAERALAPDPPNLKGSALDREHTQAPDVDLRALDAMDFSKDPQPQ